MFEDIIDRIRNAGIVFFGDLPRLGSILLFSGIILGLLIGSSYLPSLVFQGKLPVSSVCTKPYYVLPFFTNGLNTLLIETQVQCLGVSSPLVLTVALWYLEVLVIIAIAVFIAIIAFDLQG